MTRESLPMMYGGTVYLAEWLAETEAITWLSSSEYWYDRMDSQSARSLPVIYQDFDLNKRSHWSDEGQIIDFLESTQSAGLSVLDFGPGDGWPSLRIAPVVDEVVGVDSSHKRVRVCAENAARMGIENATFVVIRSDGDLPFDDETFDAVVAASSVEQTPRPPKTLAELWRVLKPAGRLRMYFESLDQYRGDREIEGRVTDDRSEVISIELMLREPDREAATAIRLTLDRYHSEAVSMLGAESGTFDPRVLTEELMAGIEAVAVAIEGCRLSHPSSDSYVKLMGQIGFRDARATRDGGTVAAEQFDVAQGSPVPRTHAELHSYLQPLVRNEVALDYPGADWITATK
jgi:SAM-dependent methyltransferase